MIIQTKPIYLILTAFTIVFNEINCDDKLSKQTKQIKLVSASKTKVWGPGLTPDKVVLPVRYFFIQVVDEQGRDVRVPLIEKFTVKLVGTSRQGECRYNLEQIDRGDGSYIVRYRVPYTCRNIEIHVTYKNEHIAQSPYIVSGAVLSDDCDCPNPLIEQWLSDMNCPTSIDQIDRDLQPFRNVNFPTLRLKILEKFNSPGSVSLCNYVIKDNQVYRECHGKYTGFKMFMDAILMSLARKVKLPDTEFFINLGDWPLVKKGGHTRTTGPYPIFSWCGSDDTFDIVLPTYDITESALQAMNRVTLDMLSVQESRLPWDEKSPKAFWRGRDARRERLQLIDISRKHPDLFNVSMTNFFFFRDEIENYGPKVPHMSFFSFFDYKYQINIDGTVAAYRFPYLLAGNAVVFKQDSPFYEHFYKSLRPNEHYIPFRRNLTDLVDQIKWAIVNDRKVQSISKNGQKFAQDNLLPTNIFCYHVKLLQEWSKKVTSDIKVLSGMERVPFAISNDDCECPHYNGHLFRDEL